MSALSGDVTIPHVGKLPKIAVLGGVGVVLWLIIAHYRKAQSAPAAGAAAAPGADPYPADGTYGDPNDPFSLDPATGVTYGDEAASGAGTGYGGYVGAGGVGGVGGVGTGLPGAGTVSGTPPGPPFSTNDQWSQYVLNFFTSSAFADMPGMTAALSLYLVGGEVSTLQQGYINDAIAFAGQPPVAGPGNFPPSIRVSGSTSSGTTSTGGTGTNPGSTGGTGSSSNASSSIANPRVVYNSGGNVEISWTPEGPATSWNVTRVGPGSPNGITNRVTKPQAYYENLARGHNFEIRIQPLPQGTVGGIDFKTK